MISGGPQLKAGNDGFSPLQNLGKCPRGSLFRYRTQEVTVGRVSFYFFLKKKTGSVARHKRPILEIMNFLFLPIKIHAQMRRETGVGGVHMIPGACAERNVIFHPRPFCFSALQREITHLFIIFLQRFPSPKKERKEKGFSLNIIFSKFYVQ